MARIIQENEEDFDLSDTTPIIDINMLKEQTLVLLINYTRNLALFIWTLISYYVIVDCL